MSAPAAAARALQPTQGLSEAQLRDLAELASDWVWEQDAGLRFVAISGEYHGGERSQAALGLTRWELPLEGVSAAQWRDHRALLERHAPFRDFEFARADPGGGALRWFSVSGRPLFDADGRFTGYRGIGREITAQKRLEHGLREREAQLRLITDSVPVAIGYIDRDWVLRFANRGFDRVFGHHPAARVGLPLEQSMGPPVFAQVKPYFERVFAGEPVAYQRSDDGADGTRRLLGVNLVPHRGEDGTVLGCYSVTMDMSALEDAEARIRLLERSVALALENTTDMMAMYRCVGDDFIIERFNPALVRFYEERFGAPQVAGWIGRPLSGFLREVAGLDPAQVRLRLAPFLRTARDGRVVRYRSSVDSPAGAQERDALLVPIAAEGGRITHLFYRGTDITELARREAELERKVEERTAELSAANQELEAFAYSVSHDLRTPLRGIDGFSQLLIETRAEALGGEGVDHLQRIRRGIQRMGSLIDDLLALSRVTRSPMRRERVDLSALALEIAADLGRQAISRTVDWRIAPGVVAQADPGLMRVMLENLLGNAWKYTRDTAGAVVEFAAASADGGVELVVRDNGAGFDMAHAGRLFQAFQRLHDPHAFEGSGIGLATVKRIVQRHGGRVAGRGEAGRGAEFRVFLPDQGGES